MTSVYPKSLENTLNELQDSVLAEVFTRDCGEQVILGKYDDKDSNNNKGYRGRKTITSQSRGLLR